MEVWTSIEDLELTPSENLCGETNKIIRFVHTAEFKFLLKLGPSLSQGCCEWWPWVDYPYPKIPRETRNCSFLELRSSAKNAGGGWLPPSKSKDTQIFTLSLPSELKLLYTKTDHHYSTTANTVYSDWQWLSTIQGRCIHRRELRNCLGH